MALSRLSVGMNMTVTTVKTVESLQMKFDEALVKWIVEMSKPFHMIEHRSFTDILSMADRHLTVPSRGTIQRRVVKRADNSQITFTKVFFDFETNVSLPIDVQSSSVYRGYLVVVHLSWIIDFSLFIVDTWL